ncbi:complement C1q tumor necrosis factor-related protein 6-like [Glandiceps talaboti]
MIQYIACVLLLAATATAQSKVAAFSVARESNFGPLEAPTSLPFDVEFTNIDGCFDLATGMFTAPISGYYYFNFNVHRGEGNPDGPVARLVVESIMQLNADECCDEDETDSASNSLVFPMKAGHKAWLHFDEGRLLTATESREVSFNGFLITEACFE